jgi:hypothetical protein
MNMNLTGIDPFVWTLLRRIVGREGGKEIF